MTSPAPETPTASPTVVGGDVPAGTPGEAAVSAGALVIDVDGSPKPKGSLRHVGHGRMIEQLAGAQPWRDAVKCAAVLVRPSQPLDGPIAVCATVTVAKPKSAPKTRRTWPITRSSGDVDKHARNLLDAITDAGIWHDDSQVVSLEIAKKYVGDPHARDFPGAAIEVRQVGA